MTVTELRNIVNYLKDNKYKFWSGDKDGFHEMETIRFPAHIELMSKFAAGKSFDLNEKECEYLHDVIPESYSDYVHYRGNFYIIDYGIGKAGQPHAREWKNHYFTSYTKINSKSLKTWT